VAVSGAPLKRKTTIHYCVASAVASRNAGKTTCGRPDRHIFLPLPDRLHSTTPTQHITSQMHDLHVGMYPPRDRFRGPRTRPFLPKPCRRHGAVARCQPRPSPSRSRSIDMSDSDAHLARPGRRPRRGPATEPRASSTLPVLTCPTHA
jgi:hypothetical protein